MIKILTSDVDTYKKVDGIKIVKEIDDTNKFISNIKKYLKKTESIVFVVSNKYDYEKIDSYSSLLFDSLKLSGITFKKYNVLDNRTIQNAEEYIKNADLVFLCGGRTSLQNEFFEEIKLKEILKEFNGIIVGQSAGSINMATHVFNSPEEQEKSDSIYFGGLELTEMNIEPHWKLSIDESDKNKIYQRNYILQESYKRNIYALCDGSYILINGKKEEFYGEIYLIRNGNIKRIN
ncbi:MAG: Type 1 glutamine amidotransferase-like domain-containing protein [Clostridia bacterium]|nr:Type 1 glutamine amidotransferase-like domain-containing protein [Clostridia bacterium]